MKNIVVVPLYESNPNKCQRLSFKQCCRVLGEHPICIVTNKGVDINQYKEIASQFSINIIREDFDPSYFASIAGYNRLMLDKRFYQRFAEYEYMLVYQLDAWVFRDELDYWCDKGYDYIGAPWIEKDSNGQPVGLGGVGNGGFSLRRVQHFIDVLSYKGAVKSGKQLQMKRSFKNNIYSFLYSLGYQNTLSYYKNDETLFEDIFLSIFLADTKLCAKTPEPEIACHFAFEQAPSFLYSKTKQLPFGCHAWQKYEYDTFWKEHIVL